MSLTLELPAGLSDELEQQAERIGISPEVHATSLLYLAASALEMDPESLEGPADQFISSIPAGKGQVVAIFWWMVRRLIEDGVVPEAEQERMAQFAERLRAWLDRTGWKPSPDRPVQPSGPSALGKYAHIAGTSEDFARLKQAEIDAEDGRGG